MEGKLKEIYQSRPVLENLVKEGANTIITFRDSGKIDPEVLGIFESGETDDITKPDKAVGQLQAKRIRESYPNWHCFIEDFNPQPDPAKFKHGDIAFWGDPLDASKLLKECDELMKQNKIEEAKKKHGYSSMAGVSLYDENKGFVPVLGMFQIIDGPLVWAYHDGKESHHNFEHLIPKERRTDKLVFGRTPVERKGILTPLQDRLNCDEVKYIRGMAPQALALVKGETDFFVYEPGVALSDVMPIAPIINAAGGEVFDLKGNKIVYSGKQHLDEGVVIVKKSKIATVNGAIGKQANVDKGLILEAAGSVYK